MSGGVNVSDAGNDGSMECEIVVDHKRRRAI
jgi:hypothetical protein